MNKTVRIGTRESELAVWQANKVRQLLHEQNIFSELVFVKSEGDIDLVTPLYEMGVQGIFTKTLDTALLNDRIDIAVHSMKDVPTKIPNGITKAAILKRGSYKDLLVFKVKDIINDWKINEQLNEPLLVDGVIATSSIRRKAQWLHRYPNHTIENLRGNVNTRLKKVNEHNWQGAIFAAAGLERINLRPENSIELDWMLPAPAQGAIMVVCRNEDNYCLEACSKFNDEDTELCTKIERDFLHELKGGCSTPISALAEISAGKIKFSGNICSVDGKEICEFKGEMEMGNSEVNNLGKASALSILKNQKAVFIMQQIIDGKK